MIEEFEEDVAHKAVEQFIDHCIQVGLNRDALGRAAVALGAGTMVAARGDVMRYEVAAFLRGLADHIEKAGPPIGTA